MEDLWQFFTFYVMNESTRIYLHQKALKTVPRSLSPDEMLLFICTLLLKPVWKRLIFASSSTKTLVRPLGYLFPTGLWAQGEKKQRRQHRGQSNRDEELN